MNDVMVMLCQDVITKTSQIISYLHSNHACH